ncbi:MAG: hypothetical protein RH917_12705 [Lacipirellulaceae bacterium]
MPRRSRQLLLSLAATTCLVASGCMQPHMRSSSYGSILDNNLFTLALDSILVPYDESRKPCNDTAWGRGTGCDIGCPLEAPQTDVVYCDEAGNCGLQVMSAKPRREPTPPLVKYEPPKPPKFFAVPTQPAFTEVASDSPITLRGSVERNFGPQLTFPGRD